MNKDTYSIPDAELAKTPASVLATQLGCAPSTIHRRRHRAGVEFKGERIPPPGRPVVFNWSALDPYPKGHEMRFRILDGQFIRITTEVEYWAYCEPMADSLPNKEARQPSLSEV
jgi:hypothetical protein